MNLVLNWRNIKLFPLLFFPLFFFEEKRSFAIIHQFSLHTKERKWWAKINIFCTQGKNSDQKLVFFSEFNYDFCHMGMIIPYLT